MSPAVLLGLVLALFARYAGTHKDDREAIAQAIVATDATEREARWLAAIAYRESGLHAGAVGDDRRSYCWAQIQMGARLTREGWSGPDLAADPQKCAVVALRVLRGSLAVCRHLPEAERLSAYASGSCASERGRRISRDRYRLAFGGGR